MHDVHIGLIAVPVGDHDEVGPPIAGPYSAIHGAGEAASVSESSSASSASVSAWSDMSARLPATAPIALPAALLRCLLHQQNPGQVRFSHVARMGSSRPPFRHQLRETSRA